MRLKIACIFIALFALGCGEDIPNPPEAELHFTAFIDDEPFEAHIIEHSYDFDFTVTGVDTNTGYALSITIDQIFARDNAETELEWQTGNVTAKLIADSTYTTAPFDEEGHFILYENNTASGPFSARFELYPSALINDTLTSKSVIRGSLYYPEF